MVIFPPFIFFFLYAFLFVGWIQFERICIIQVLLIYGCCYYLNTWVLIHRNNNISNFVQVYFSQEIVDQKLT
jgi:hypothetical protein